MVCETPSLDSRPGTFTGSGGPAPSPHHVCVVRLARSTRSDHDADQRRKAAGEDHADDELPGPERIRVEADAVPSRDDHDPAEAQQPERSEHRPTDLGVT